jgi:membrane-bound lytic murein transglycosylase D
MGSKLGFSTSYNKHGHVDNNNSKSSVYTEIASTFELRKKLAMSVRFILIFFLLFSLNAEANGTGKKEATKKDSLNSLQLLDLTELQPDDPILQAMDSILSEHFFLFSGQETEFFDTARVEAMHDSIVPMDAELIKERLASIDAETPFNLVYNDRVHAFINLYLNKRPQVSSRVMGLSAYYFPLFEEILAKNNMPLEFKYLAVVESALKANARSRAGAMGLWQFMYSTGKIYGLKTSSYIDDRMDPIKATEAACGYFKYLYDIYGDWDLVMAAYNCGPGNVNKAIRRSGGRRGYWEIYRWLPRETRGYVPAFIAVNYMMNFGKEHNILPLAPISTYFENDTIHVNRKVYMKQLAQELKMSYDHLKWLNPTFKYGIVPEDGQTHVLVLPKDKLGQYLSNEELVAAKIEAATQNAEPVFAWKEVRKIHYVRRGEYLGIIARQYGTSVGQIQRWNNMRGTNIRVGQRLVVYTREKVLIEGEFVQKKQEASPQPVAEPKSDFQFYTIQAGDTLWDIARNNGISLDRLREYNSNLNHRRLKPGDKIIIGVQG